MTREEAIRRLNVYSSTNGSGLCTDKQHNEAKQIAIEALERTRWIPVSEGLPKDGEPVNVTWVNHSKEQYYADIKDKPFTATCVHFNEQWYWWSPFCVEILIENDVEIIAWKPLPEPYKAESEDKK